MNMTNLEIVGIPYGTPEWYKFRQSGIGASEIGVLLGLVDKYSSPAQLFHEKVGTVSPWTDDNQSMAWGRWTEDLIADLWQYWEGDDVSYIKNKTEGRMIRRCRKLTGFVRNKKYPQLFASPDRIINREGGFYLDTGVALASEGNLEIKTIEERSAAMWQSGVPVYYIAQINQQMLVMDMDYSELAILENGRRLSVIPIRRSDALCHEIVTTSKHFWEKRVLPAKEAFFKSQELRKMGREADAEKYDALIQKLEPDPSPGDAYKQFMSERYQKKREEIDLTPKMKLYGMMHRSAHLMAEYFTAQKSLAANILAKEMADYGTEWAKTPDVGYIRYFKTAGTNVFRVDNRLRLEKNEDMFDRLTSDIDVNFLKWNPKIAPAKKNGK